MEQDADLGAVVATEEAGRAGGWQRGRRGSTADARRPPPATGAPGAGAGELRRRTGGGRGGRGGPARPRAVHRRAGAAGGGILRLLALVGDRARAAAGSGGSGATHGPRAVRVLLAELAAEHPAPRAQTIAVLTALARTSAARPIPHWSRWPGMAAPLLLVPSGRRRCRCLSYYGRSATPGRLQAGAELRRAASAPAAARPDGWVTGALAPPPACSLRRLWRSHEAFCGWASSPPKDDASFCGSTGRGWPLWATLERRSARGPVRRAGGRDARAAVLTSRAGGSGEDQPALASKWLSTPDLTAVRRRSTWCRAAAGRAEASRKSGRRCRRAATEGRSSQSRSRLSDGMVYRPGTHARWSGSRRCHRRPDAPAEPAFMALGSVAAACGIAC